MRILKHPAVLLAAMLIFVGCATRAAYNTLYSLEHSTTAAYDTFSYGVIRGKWKTNDVPTVSKNYDRFQIGMQAAVELAQYDKTQLAPSNVVHLATVVLHSIAEAKAR